MGARLSVQHAAFESRAFERALFWGRCAGGVVIFALGPLVTPAAPAALIRALGLYFIAYAALMLWVSSRADSVVARERALWLAYVFDTLGFLSALVLSATDPQWLAVGAAPLYVFVAVARMGLLGGVTATLALAATHVMLALWRESSLGIQFDPARTLASVSSYALAAVLGTAIDAEKRALRDRALTELERSQRLESLGALAGGIAHDFNNLLAVIRNDAYIALTGTLSAAARRRIEEIKEEAERGVSLTRQMLVYAQGARATKAVRIDVRREIAYAERLLRHSLGSGVTLDVRVSDGVPDIELEAGQLEQILMNLVVNARDAMPDGGRVTVAAGDVHVGANDVPGLAAGPYLRVVVSDTGCGMAPEVARRAFEPFFTTKPKGKGTGLGLSTVYGVARRAGGHVGLVSVPARGTTVTVHLPAAATPAVDAARATGDASESGAAAREASPALVEVA